MILDSIGLVHGERDEMEEARSHYEAALVIQREAGDRRLEASALSNLGMTYVEQGRLEEARAYDDASPALDRRQPPLSVVGRERTCLVDLSGSAAGSTRSVRRSRAQYLSQVAFTVAWATPGLEKSHTPSGKTAARRTFSGVVKAAGA